MMRCADSVDLNTEHLSANKIPDLHFVDCENIKQCHHCVSRTVPNLSTTSKEELVINNEQYLNLDNGDYFDKDVVDELHNKGKPYRRLTYDHRVWTCDLSWTAANRSNSIWWAEENSSPADETTFKRFISTNKSTNKRDVDREGRQKWLITRDKTRGASEWDLRSGLHAVSDLDLAGSIRRYSGSCDGKPPLPSHFNRTGSLRTGMKLHAQVATIQEGHTTCNIPSASRDAGNSCSSVNLTLLLPSLPDGALSRSMDTLLGVSSTIASVRSVFLFT